MTHTILVECQDNEIRLWLDNELLGVWKRKYVAPWGKPLEQAKLIEQVLTLVGVGCEIELGDGFEDYKEQMK